MRVVRAQLFQMNSGSRLRFITCQSTKKIADVSHLCKSTENRRRARKLEKGKCPDFQMGEKMAYVIYLSVILTLKTRAIKSSLIKQIASTLERTLWSLGVKLIFAKLYYTIDWILGRLTFLRAVSSIIDLRTSG